MEITSSSYKPFVFRIAIVYALTSFMEVVIFFSYSYQKDSFVIR